MWLNIIMWVTAIISIASVVAAITPTPKDNHWLKPIYNVIDWCALNIGKAKEK
jgi:hypothetical protein|tara:strand:- start:351 stop:509 length:159 start_codon:yes stop_codon:yes gene_type:complete